MKWIIAIVVLAAALGGWVWFQVFDERRAHMTAAVGELTRARNAVSEEFARAKAMPGPREFPVSDRHVRSIKLEADGRLVMTLAYPEWSGADGKHVVYQPRVAGATLEWRCRSDDLDPRYLPRACR